MAFVEQKGSMWNPEKEGEQIVGEILEISNSNFGKQYVIKNELDGEEVETPSHKQLQDRMRNAKVGDRVRITYKGTKPTNKGNPLQVYKVELDNKEEEVQ